MGNDLSLGTGAGARAVSSYLAGSRASSARFVGRYAAILDDDDPFETLRHNNLAEQDPSRRHDFFAPTLDANAICVGSTDSYDALHLVNQALEQMPERGDYLMMRFELLAILGRKQEFAAALESAWRNPMIVRKLDGKAVRRLWKQVARWEPLPACVQLPDEDAAVVAAERALRQARFNEMALNIAAKPLYELRMAYASLRAQPRYIADLARRTAGLLQRPTPLHFAVNLSSIIGPHTRVFFKREDQRGVSAALENAAVQVYVAAQLGREQLIAGNDEDAHSLALAQTCAHFGLQCTIVMAEGEVEAKTALVQELRDTGAYVRACTGLTMESDDPREAALRLWAKRPDEIHFAQVGEAGPAPFPTMIADFRAILGHEAELQLRTQAGGGHRPRAFITARYSRGDSAGFLLPQLPRGGVKLLIAEPEHLNPAAMPEDRMAFYNGSTQLHARLRGSRPQLYTTVSDVRARQVQERIDALEGIKLGLEDARAAALVWTLADQRDSGWDVVVLAA